METYLLKRIDVMVRMNISNNFLLFNIYIEHSLIAVYPYSCFIFRFKILPANSVLKISCCFLFLLNPAVADHVMSFLARTSAVMFHFKAPTALTPPWLKVFSVLEQNYASHNVKKTITERLALNPVSA